MSLFYTVHCCQILSVSWKEKPHQIPWKNCWTFWVRQLGGTGVGPHPTSFTIMFVCAWMMENHPCSLVENPSPCSNSQHPAPHALGTAEGGRAAKYPSQGMGCHGHQHICPHSCQGEWQTPLHPMHSALALLSVVSLPWPPQPQSWECGGGCGVLG